MAQKAKPYGGQWQAAMRLYASRQGVRCSAMAVLSVLIQFVDYDTGQSRPGRTKIKEYTGASDRNLDRILKDLRDRQLILPLAYLTGGRSRATCYAFAVPAWHTVEDVRERGINPRQDGGGFENGTDHQNPRQIGEKPPPNWRETPAKLAVPSGRSDISREKEAASRGQEGPSAFGARVASEEQIQFASDVKYHGYGRAKELEYERSATKKGGADAPAEN